MTEKGNDAMLPKDAPERIAKQLRADGVRWFTEQAEVAAQPVLDGDDEDEDER